MHDIFVINTPEWDSFARARSEAEYEHAVAPAAIRIRKTNAICTSEETFRLAIEDEVKWARFLLHHEHWHRQTGEMHPTGIVGMLWHALSVGFDARAGSRLLRWRWHEETLPDYLKWETDLRARWQTGALRPMSVSEVLRAEQSS
jgi:hypothetical protein